MNQLASRKAPKSGASDGHEVSGTRDDRGQPIPLIEWIIGGVGLLLVVAVVAFMIAEALRSGGGPPQLAVRTDSVTAMGTAGHIVHFTVENRARTSAATVGIAGELRDGDAIETSRATVDYVPGRSRRRGGLMFVRDPARSLLRLRVEGYQEP